jgi:hypothetical protein
LKVLDPGHRYELNLLDYDPYDAPPPPHELIFVKREGEGYPGNDGHYPGTTIQEVLRAVVSRLEYVGQQNPHKDTTAALEDVKEAIWHLECRAAERHKRPKPGFEEATFGPCCTKCNHVGCQGGCH